MKRAIGVDGCRDGWIAVAFETEDGPGTAAARFFSGFGEIVAAYPEAVIVVDMPVGFAEGREGRGCDEEARRILGPRRNSVFTPPCRAALFAVDYPAANALNRGRTGKGLSKQAWMIAPKMREIDAVITPAMQDRVLEGHPELGWTVATGAPMTAHKAGFHGHYERLRVLHGLGFDPGAAARTLPAGIDARPDDLLDACILAHVAQKRLTGVARVFPDSPRVDARGLRMEMWA